MPKPILRDLPFPILTPRLSIRPPQPGDGPALNAAVVESQRELAPHMPWARGPAPTEDDSEENCRRAHVRFLLREDLRLHLYDRATGELVGCSGLHRFDWERGIFEVGYWARTSRVGEGLITEATNAITRYAFEVLGARRVEVHCNTANVRSWAVPERLSFPKEGVLRNFDRYVDEALGNLDTAVYARTSPYGLPPLDVAW